MTLIGEGAMTSMTFYARTSDHGYETCVEHLSMAGCLAGGFAQVFGHLDDGLLAGLVHDLGKYSDAFQRRIQDPDHSGLVDHSTAGAMLLVQHGCPLASMAVAGHHAGLPDFGSRGELEGPTYSARMNRAFSAGSCGPLALSKAWEQQLNIPQSAFEKGTKPSNSIAMSGKSGEQSFYSDMMLTRMLFSTLVDGDRLDAEFFTSNRENRTEHPLLESLKEYLGADSLASEQAPKWDKLRKASLMVVSECDTEDRARIKQLTDIIENKANRFLGKPNKKPLDIKRCELLAQCLACGQDTSYGTGLYTLTAPTGSGKTISSIAFALEHAHTNNLHRVIYVIPYTSIIDQTVNQFEAIFGTDAVLPHYSEAPYQLKDESDMDEMDLKRALAAENWNAPIVVTTAVQFFESLYSNKTSRCRKLHNIANSVIIFDEAQTLPVPYLRPCIRAIAELVKRYGSTAVLCTATQPELQPLLNESFNYYDQKGNDDKSSLVSSLVSGKLVVPEKTHPRIKNVAGAHPAGSALITFNAAAFCSHGAVQNENAPMSKREAYEYTTALNTLLADESRVQRIGNDTVISWACCGNAVYSDLFSGLYSSETQSNGLDEKTIKDATCALAQGRRYDYEGIRLNPDEHFHILALSPNKSRLAIRFYLTDTFGVFAHNIEQYYQDTEIRRPRYDKTGFLPILRLLGQTIRKQRKDENAPVKKQKKKSAIENVSSEMVSAIMQAILNGTPYPVTLINVVERRINVERDVPPDKAAIIKAYYLRKTTNEQFKEVLQMDINEESEYLPYVLGRIFSIYEQIQLGAIPNINTTIKDKYFTSASTTPARIFPILGDLAAKHMRKAWKSEGLKIKLDKVLGTLTQKVGDHYPSRLSLEERGAFQLGYYFENQKRFNKTNKSNEDNEQGENND